MASINSNNFWENLVSDVMKAQQIKNSSELATIESDLTKVLEKMYPKNFKIYMFGSRTMAIASDASDLDIYVDIGNTFNRFYEKPTQLVLQHQIRLRQQLSGSEFQTKWRYINHFRGLVPIVIENHIPTGIECDVSFSHGLAFAQNELVNYLFELQPIGRYMCVFLRQWLKDKSLKEKFRSHINTLMVIFFLQTKKLLPSIQKLQEGLLSNMDPWITGFNKLSLSSFGMEKYVVTEEGTRAILKEFFKYYGAFDYASSAISPYLGIVVDKCGLVNRMPRRVWSCRKGIFITTIVVQDFLQLNHNKASLITPYDLQLFKEKCLLN